MFIETAWPASLTALHLVMGLFRHHRSAARSVWSPFVLPSVLFTIAPWIFHAPPGLALGLMAHIAWLIACEFLAPAVPPVAATVETQAPHTSSRADAEVAPPRAHGFTASAVIAVIDEAPDIKTFRLARPQGFEFRPGQFLTVRLQIAGKPHVRCYSISSAPHISGYLEISVRRQGLVSGALHGTLRPGSTLSIHGPAGAFIYPSSDERPLALIAGGIGITPLLSMTRHAVATDPSRPVTLLYSARSEEDLAFQRELRILGDCHPQLRVAVALTGPAPSAGFHSGHIDAAVIRRHVPAAADTLFYLCGPARMLADMRQLLRSLGAPDEQVRFEEFRTAVAAAQVNAAASVSATEAAPAAASVRVTFTASNRVVTASSATTLLDTAEAEGVPLVSSCRAGVCLSCRTRLRFGSVDCRSEVLDAEDRAAGFILPCVSWPTSDCEVEA
jgi:ferredoxin-NADP reductase